MYTHMGHSIREGFHFDAERLGRYLVGWHLSWRRWDLMICAPSQCWFRPHVYHGHDSTIYSCYPLILFCYRKGGDLLEKQSSPQAAPESEG